MSKHSDMVKMYHTLEKETNDLGSTIHFDHKNFNTFGRNGGMVNDKI